MARRTRSWTRPDETPPGGGAASAPRPRARGRGEVMELVELLALAEILHARRRRGTRAGGPRLRAA
jgi:hypothetical protein